MVPCPIHTLLLKCCPAQLNSTADQSNGELPKLEDNRLFAPAKAILTVNELNVFLCMQQLVVGITYLK